MAASFAALPAKVLWRLASSEVPDEAAVVELGIGNNTKVAVQAACVKSDTGYADCSHAYAPAMCIFL